MDLIINDKEKEIIADIIDVSTFRNFLGNKELIPHYIEHEGLRLITISGKSVWKSKGDASRAFTNYINSITNHWTLKSSSFENSSGLAKYLLSQKIFEIKPWKK